MALTSGLFISLVAIAAFGALAVTVWLWPRAAGRRVRDFGARIGMLAVSQVLVIAAFLAFLNGYFAFFGSWSELLGTSTTTTQVQLSRPGASGKPIVITATDLGPVPGGSRLPLRADGTLARKQPGARHSPAGTIARPQPSRSPHSSGAQPSRSRHQPGRAHPSGGRVSRTARVRPGQPGVNRNAKFHGTPAVNGEVLQIAINGQRSGIAVTRDYVYLPPQYFQPAYAKARFPVVLGLTGYPNEPWSLVKWLGLPAFAARLVAAKRINPAIYLMMNVSPALPEDTECTNVPAGLQVLTFFDTDVPLAMEHTFRVQSGRTGWATLGYSTGGLCATKLAMMDPSRFSAAVSMAGYYNAVKDRTTGNLYGGSAAYQNENDLFWRLIHLPAPPVSVLVTSSRVGELTYPGSIAFLRLIHAPMQGYSLILPQGGHNYGTWDQELPQSLEWLSKRLTPALPQQPLAVQRS